jgi:transposase
MSRLYKEGNRLQLVLNKQERRALTHILNRSPKPYQRERAAALLKVADGMSPHAVAKGGLLKERDPDTVYNWVFSFDANGIKSLSHAKRRHKGSLGEGEKEQLFSTITEKSPQDFSIHRSRWTLKSLRDALPFLGRIYRSLSGIWYLLRRNRIHYKRSRDEVPCPDRRKNEKIRRIRATLGYARNQKNQVVLLFLDEFSFYRQPLRGPAWWPVGRREQPKAQRSCNANTRGRVVAALNAVSGELIYHVASKINVPCFCAFLRHIKEIYPGATHIYVVLDNWPTVHKHAQTLETFEEIGIHPVWLPTYSPQSNPIELLWEQLNGEVLRLHRDSDDWSTLKERVCSWLDAFSVPSDNTIKMVGLFAKPAIRVNAA